ncbi:hypothetical protein JCM21900_003757 [Sporobolomyces salmonicolor]
MLRLTLLSAAAFLSADAVRASVVSTSVFPNSACAGASSSLGGLVGVGKVTLSSGEVETHCGCPSDNLPSFEICPSSSNGESVCNSVLNLETGAFTASCGVVACSGASCPSTVVNTVVIDETDCYTGDKGSIGIITVDGESRCGCSAGPSGDFTACPSPANGRATCVSTDSDFLGMAYSHKEKAECGVTCDEDYFLTPGGSCTKLNKRAPVGPSGLFNGGGPGKVGPSASWHPVPQPTKLGPSASHHPSSAHHHSSHPGSPAWSAPASPTLHHPHLAHTPTYPTASPVASSATTSAYSYHHHHPSHSEESSHPSSRPSWETRTGGPGGGHHTSMAIKVGPSSSVSAPASSWTGHHGHHASQYHHHHPSSRPSWETRTASTESAHHHHHPSSRPSWETHTASTESAHHHHHPSSRPSWESRTAGPVKVGPSATTTATAVFRSAGPGKVGPSAAFGAGVGKVGPSQVARRAAEEFVFADVCAQDERSCPAGAFGDFSCVRLDDVTECGGCNSTGDAKNCLEIEGASSVACLRGGCVVRACQTGFVQTSEGTCEPKSA